MAAISSLARTLLPPLRRPFVWSSVWPLAAFSVVFLGTVLALELLHIVMFARPWGFAALLAAPWVWWIHLTGAPGLPRLRSVLALLLRLAVVGVFAMLMAHPRAVRKSDQLAVVFALDLSDSIGEGSTETALTWVVKRASPGARPDKDMAGLVVFGRNAAVELPPRTSFPFEGAINSQLSSDATNLEKGLSLASAMVPEHVHGRIVLISDGTATEGNLAAVLGELRARGIPVDVLPIAYEYENEVWLERLDVPKRVKAGETYEASVVVSALKGGKGTLVLRENGRVIHRAEVEYAPGKNRLRVPLYMREPGYYEYTARLTVPEGADGTAENNVAVNSLFLRGEGKVLLVHDPEGQEEDWSHLVKAMRESKRSVDVKTPVEVPRNALSLMPYDLIVFCNVGAEGFDPTQFEAIRDAVFDQGVGFLMVGGKNSYGPGGYHRTRIEQLLPVTMDISQKKVMPKAAMAIILHTCEFAEGNTWAKRITKQAIKVLSKKDDVGVLYFAWGGPGGTGDRWLFKLQPAANYEKMVKLINQANPGDMPAFGPSMTLGFNGLKANDAAMKHMIIISDGDPQPPSPKLLQGYVKEKISVTTVAINPHGGLEQKIMSQIAKVTGGRYYYAKNPAQLPSIFIKEAKTLKRSMIQNKVFGPRIVFPSPILKGLGDLPLLRGYVLTTPKPRATTILKGPDKEDVDPVLATWRHGLGKTAAWTSDLSSNWAKHWVSWDHYRAFVRQLVIDVSRVERKSHLHLRAFSAGGSGVVQIEDHFPGSGFLEVQAQIKGPRNESKTLTLKQVGLRRYQAEVPLWGKGRYTVAAIGVGGERKEQAFGGFAVPYSPEYLRFRSNPIVLERIAEQTGGRVLVGDETAKVLFERPKDPKRSSRPIILWFLLALACLIPLDVGLRRIQIDWYVIRRWLGFGRVADSGATLSSLLQRKQELEAGRPDRAAPLPAAPRTGPRSADLTATAPRPVGTQPGASAPAPDDQPTDNPDQPMSTTAHLLKMKRRWNKDETPDE